jgi:DNA-binding response OmpR family regulator
VTVCPTPPLAASAGGLAAPTPHEARILIVSPMPSQVSQLEGLLRGAGYARVCGSHAPAGTAGLRTPFDLILLHLRLPDLQGFDAIAPLLDERRGQQPPPVLAITTGPGEAWRALQAGARDSISAPFEPAELLARMHHLLEAQRAHRALVAHQRTLEQRLVQRTDAWRISESRCRALTALLTDNGPTPRAAAVAV